MRRRLRQHVAGTSLLSGNQIIVGDVSGNGGISSFDAGQVARYVASSPPFGNAGTWKFLPTSRSYPSVASNITGENYSALLMGEVSGNWGNAVGGRQLAVGSEETLVGGQWSVDGRKLTVAVGSQTTAEKEIVVPINVQGVADKEIISYEFDLRYDPSVIRPLENPVDVHGTVSRGFSVVINAKEPGVLRVVFYGAYPIEEDGVLLNLRFTVVGACWVGFESEI